MRNMGDARIIQQDYWLIKSMEQEGDKLEKKPRENEDQVTSVNDPGGIHQQGGAASSGTIQGGEQDQLMQESGQSEGLTRREDLPRQERRKAESGQSEVLPRKERRKARKDKDKRMGEPNDDAEMKEKGKRRRDELIEDDSEEQAKKYATVEIEGKYQEGSIRQIYWACSVAHN